MKTERELFEEKYKELTGCDDFSLSKKKDGDYKFDGAYFGWLMWQASTNREGYKLVPITPTDEMIVAIENKVQEQLDASAITADMFRLDGERIFESLINAI